jgi:hypothetical protein
MKKLVLGLLLLITPSIAHSLEPANSPWIWSGTNAATLNPGSLLVKGLGAGVCQSASNGLFSSSYTIGSDVGVVASASSSSALSLSLPSALPASSSMLSLSGTSVVDPGGLSLEKINFTTDSSAYSGATTLYGISESITQSKPGSASNNNVTVGALLSVIDNATLANTGAYANYGAENSVTVSNGVTGAVTGNNISNYGSSGVVTNQVTSSSSGSNTINSVGLYGGVVDSAVTSSSGTLTLNDYGVQGMVSSVTAAPHIASIGYGGYFSSTGAGTNYGVYSNAGTNVLNGITGINKTAPGAMLEVDSNAVGEKNEILKEITSQTADPLEIQNSSGTVIVGVSAAGNLGVATALPTAGIGINLALPATSSGTSYGIGLSETGVVFPATANIENFSLASDTTAYAGSGAATGINILITNQKPAVSTGANSSAASGVSATAIEEPTISSVTASNNYTASGVSGVAELASNLAGTTTGQTFTSTGLTGFSANSIMSSASGTNNVVQKGVTGNVTYVFASSTAGTLNSTDYGGYFIVSGKTGANYSTTGYGVYANANGDGTNYDFYAASGNPNYFSGLVNLGNHLQSSQSGTITLTSCGTGSSVTSGANDVRGNISVGTLATSCQVNFITAYAAAPYCVVTATNATAAGLYISATAVGSFTVTGTTIASATFNYHCIQ